MYFKRGTRRERGEKIPRTEITGCSQTRIILKMKKEITLFPFQGIYFIGFFAGNGRMTTGKQPIRFQGNGGKEMRPWREIYLTGLKSINQNADTRRKISTFSQQKCHISSPLHGPLSNLFDW